MGKAARAIILKDDKILLMHRAKEGSEYYTLVGGLTNEGETLEQALSREVKEETGLDVARAQLVFIEEHPYPYNEQYVFLCEAAPHDSVAIQVTSEEGLMNQVGINVHKLEWVDQKFFPSLAFRTPGLHRAIAEGLKSGFPDKPVRV